MNKRLAPDLVVPRAREPETPAGVSAVDPILAIDLAKHKKA